VFGGTKHGAPNHVLVNEYRPGEGIMPHVDGAAYEPVVATVSLGGTTILDLYEKDGDEMQSVSWRILQESGSLLITTGHAYGSLLHGISSIKTDENLGPDTVINWSLLGDQEAFAGGANDRQTRISLTYRDVIKVSNIGISILGRAAR